jgi:hypothetical protein
MGQNDTGSRPNPPDTGLPPVVDTTIKLNRPVKPVDTPKARVKMTDTLAIDTTQVQPVVDSVEHMPWEYTIPVIQSPVDTIREILSSHPYFNFASRPVVVRSDFKSFKGKETLFYVLIAFLLVFSLLRQAFPKYFSDLVRLLFRTTLKQKQIREQLMQNPLPSFLLNVFFVLSAGLYIDLLLNYYNEAPIENFWLLFLYCSLALALVYSTKYIGLNLTGWLFNIKGATDVYLFIVFLINKVIGIFLLPFLVLLPFVGGDVARVILVISWCGIGVFFIYRYFLAYPAIRNQVRLNPFHFLLYFCAFEIAPLLLIYKGLLFFFH